MQLSLERRLDCKAILFGVQLLSHRRSVPDSRTAWRHRLDAAQIAVLNW
jgi:hypothetical protein